MESYVQLRPPVILACDYRIEGNFQGAEFSWFFCKSRCEQYNFPHFNPEPRKPPPRKFPSIQYNHMNIEWVGQGQSSSYMICPCFNLVICMHAGMVREMAGMAGCSQDKNMAMDPSK
jgi:hypothetical protein